ncbi:anti-CBASS protein Acb1 family protein [Bacillus sp. B-TM1]
MAYQLHQQFESNTGEHDTRNYYDSIATKQIWSLKPFMMKLLRVIVPCVVLTSCVHACR